MKSTRIAAGIATAALTLGLGGVALTQAVAAPPTDRPWGQASASALATSPLSDAEKDTLLKMTDEERMARDLYQKIAEKYPAATQFSRIAASEQRHYDRMLDLLGRYNLDKPSATVGEYADKDVQKLYDDWLKQAQTSQEEAYQVGVALEQRDIVDLEAAIKESDNADLDRVYGNQLEASRNHEQAFLAGPAGAATGTGMHRGAGAGNQGQGQGFGRMNGQGQGARDGSCLQN